MRKYIIILLCAVVLLSGCFSSPPVYKKATRQPLPKESFASEERTRQAVHAFGQWIAMMEVVNDDMFCLSQALSAKIGIPAQALIMSKEAISALAENLKKDTTVMRKKKKEWEKEFDKDNEFVQKQEGIIAKAKRGMFWIIFWGALLCLLCPSFVIGVIRFFKARFKKAKKKFDDEFDMSKRFRAQTQKAVDRIKDLGEDVWDKIEPIFKEEHDQDIRNDIKNKSKGTV